jgi:shikimate dehydrogenase
MREYGLIGYPLGHSYSQKYFTEKFKKLNITDAKYGTYPISEISKLKNIISSHKNLLGLNVTTPYKELVIPYLDELDATALRLGNVNTIKILRKDNLYYLKGYNTDIYGLEETFKEIDFPKNSKALIFGTGGSAKTSSYVLQNLNISATNVSRLPSKAGQITYKDLTKTVLSDYNIIINATPVGMHPNINDCPNFNYDFITENHICIDLVYNPAKTLFLSKCEEKGANIINGLKMLYTQADKAWEIWNKKE